MVLVLVAPGPGAVRGASRPHAPGLSWIAVYALLREPPAFWESLTQLHQARGIYTPGPPSSGFAVDATYPVRVRHVGESLPATDHQAWIGAYKHRLETAGLDLITAGPPGGEYLLVFGWATPAQRAR